MIVLPLIEETQNTEQLSVQNSDCVASNRRKKTQNTDQSSVQNSDCVFEATVWQKHRRAVIVQSRKHRQALSVQVISDGDCPQLKIGKTQNTLSESGENTISVEMVNY